MAHQRALSTLLIIAIALIGMLSYAYYRKADASREPFARWLQGERVQAVICETAESDFDSSVRGKIYIKGGRFYLAGLMSERGMAYGITAVSLGDRIYVWFEDPNNDHANFIVSKQLFAAAVPIGEMSEEDGCRPWWISNFPTVEIPADKDFVDISNLGADELNAIISE